MGLGGLGIIIGERDFPFIPRVDLVVVAWLEEMLGRFKSLSSSSLSDEH